jgi:4-aminobutyrate aminotransferase
MTTTTTTADPAASDVQQLLARRRAFMGPQLYMFYDPPLHLVRGEGVWLYDAKGRAYLDVYNNVPHVGHCHPHVVEAIARQAARLNTNTRYLYDEVLDYAERLTASLPAGLDVAAFVNSGSEAVDLAWRIAKAHTGQRGALIMEEAYHGWTDAVEALSPAGKPDSALAAHVRMLAPPDRYRGAHGEDAAAYASDADRAIGSLQAAGLQPAMFIADPGFCTNGILEPMPGYLERVYGRMRAAGAVCVADEVQTGFGRTGRLFAVEHYGIEPDLITVAKSIAAGLPLSGVIGKAEIMDAPGDSAVGGTYVGNPVAIAAAHAVLDVIAEEGLNERAQAIGETIRARMEAWRDRFDAVADVRGLGAMLAIGIETGGQPDADLATAVAEAAARKGLLLLKAGIYSNCIRVLVPLVIEDAELDEALGVWEEALQEAGA